MLDLILSSQDTSGLNIVKLFPSSPTYWYYLKAQWTMNRQRRLQKVAKHGTFGQFYPCGEWGWGVETIQTSEYGGPRSSNLFRQWIQNAWIGQLINVVLQHVPKTSWTPLCNFSAGEQLLDPFHRTHNNGMDYKGGDVLSRQNMTTAEMMLLKNLFRSERLVSPIFLYYVLQTH